MLPSSEQTTSNPRDFHFTIWTYITANGQPVPGATVTATNSDTGNSVSYIEAGDGYYGVNLINLVGGWEYGDTILVEATRVPGCFGNNSTVLSTANPYWCWVNVTLYCPPDVQVMRLLDGWNLISLTRYGNSTAREFLNEHPGVTLVYFYDAATDTMRLVSDTSPPEIDFPLEEGAGYFVAAAYSTTIFLAGGPITNVSIHLYPGWNMLGWYHEYATTARSLLLAIRNCTVVYWYDALNGTARIVTSTSPPEVDFIVTAGMGLFVSVDEPSIWHGEG
jgi:hypothetical protein